MKATRHPSPRSDDTGRTLVSRHVVAYLAHRHVDYVRRTIPAVACDVTTRAALLDLDQAEETLAGRAQRNRSARRPITHERHAHTAT
jgi:hypothetical protein